MQIRILRRDVLGSLELGDCFGGSSQTVQGFSAEHVRGRRIGLLLQNLSKLVQSAGVFFSPEATLSQHVVQFGIARIRLCRDLQILDSLVETLCPVVAKAQQRGRLYVM